MQAHMSSIINSTGLMNTRRSSVADDIPARQPVFSGLPYMLNTGLLIDEFLSTIMDQES